MAEWLCSGLQIRGSRFDSGFRLHNALMQNRFLRLTPQPKGYPDARVVKLVDTRDLKSLVSKDVPVQVRPRAPFYVLTHSIPVNCRLYSYCLSGLCVLLRPMRSIVIPKHMGSTP